MADVPVEPASELDEAWLRAVLTANAGWWSHLFDATDTGWVVLDDTGTLRMVSRSLTRLLDRERDEIVRLGVAGFSHPDDMTADQRLFEELLSGRRDVYTIDKRYRRGDGSWMWGQLHVVRVPAPSGDGRWIVGMVRDITARKETEERLQRFIAEASHELRTPVAVLGGVAGLLSSAWETMEDEERSSLISMLARQSEQLQSLLRSLLDLARIERGIEVAVAPVDVGALVTDVVHSLDIEAADVDIRTDEPFATDPAVLRQVLTNLVANAQRYGAAPIEIAVHRENSTLVLTVRDHGRGLSDDTLDQLFQPFTANAGGVGLGLAITRGFVESLGGIVWYENAAPGARFALRLPPLGALSGAGS